MITLISPAKTMDFDSRSPLDACSRPLFRDDAEKLVRKMRQFSRKKLSELMHISKSLAELNHQRFLDWGSPESQGRAKQAIYAYQGDVYQGLEAEHFTEEDLDFAQDHLLILSGLYGLLRPKDLIEPYRLEMGVPVAPGRKKDLYQYWDGRLTAYLNKALEEQGTDTVVNLASQEYWNAIEEGKVKGKIITPIFKDFKNGELKFITFYGKRARGWLAAWLVQNRVTDLEEMKGFEREGYQFDPSYSEGNNWVYTRQAPH